MLIVFKMFTLSKGSLLSQSLTCIWQPVLKWLVLQAWTTGGVDLGETAVPVLPLLLILLLGLKYAAGTKSTVSINCLKERAGGNMRRMISQFCLLTGSLVAAFPLKPNTVCPTGLRHIWQYMERSLKEFSLISRRSGSKAGRTASADVSSLSDKADL